MALRREPSDIVLRIAIYAFGVSWAAIAFLFLGYLPSAVQNKVNEQLAPTQRLAMSAKPELLPDYLRHVPAPVDKKLEMTRNVLDDATRKKIKIPQSALSETAVQLAAFAKQNPTAWNLLVQLTEYKSAVNAGFQVGAVPEKPRSCLASRPALGVRSMTLTQCFQRLDETTWENVAFENSIIIYDGGYLRLKNVSFKNCVFQIKRTPRGSQFALGVISAPDSVALGIG